MCKYHIVILDTLVALECAFLVARCNIIRLYKKPRRKDWVTEKSTLKNLCEEHHFCGCTPSCLYHFLSLFSSTPSLSSTPGLWRKKNFCSRKKFVRVCVFVVRGWRPLPPSVYATVIRLVLRVVCFLMTCFCCIIMQTVLNVLSDDSVS